MYCKENTSLFSLQFPSQPVLVMIKVPPCLEIFSVMVMSSHTVTATFIEYNPECQQVAGVICEGVFYSNTISGISYLCLFSNHSSS